MSTWINVVLEIIKITLPALVVFLTVYYLFKTYLDKQYQIKLLEYQQKEQSLTLPLRLQAYERLTLLCERIAIPNMLLRLREQKQCSGALRLALLMTIQHEFDHNITQQIYVSEQLWQILKISRDDTVNIINGLSERHDPKGPSNELARALQIYLEEQPLTSLDKAQTAIKREVSLLFP